MGFGFNKRAAALGADAARRRSQFIYFSRERVVGLVRELRFRLVVIEVVVAL